MGIESRIVLLISEIFKSAPRAGLFLATVVVLGIIAIKLTPAIMNSVFGFIRELVASRSKDQSAMINIIQSELSANREDAARQAGFNERMAKGVEGALQALQELTARVASMDHRIGSHLDTLRTESFSAHKEMGKDLSEIKGYIAGLS